MNPSEKQRQSDDASTIDGNSSVPDAERVRQLVGTVVLETVSSITTAGLLQNTSMDDLIGKVTNAVHTQLRQRIIPNTESAIMKAVRRAIAPLVGKLLSNRPSLGIRTTS